MQYIHDNKSGMLQVRENEISPRKWCDGTAAQMRTLGGALWPWPPSDTGFLCTAAGELYRLGLLTEGIVHQCVKQLINKKKKGSVDDYAEDLECLCQIMMTCGRRLDHEKAKVGFDAVAFLAQNFARRVLLLLFFYIVNVLNASDGIVWQIMFVLGETGRLSSFSLKRLQARTLALFYCLIRAAALIAAHAVWLCVCYRPFVVSGSLQPVAHATSVETRSCCCRHAVKSVRVISHLIGSRKCAKRVSQARELLGFLAMRMCCENGSINLQQSSVFSWQDPVRPCFDQRRGRKHHQVPAHAPFDGK